MRNENYGRRFSVIFSIVCLIALAFMSSACGDDNPTGNDDPTDTTEQNDTTQNNDTTKTDTNKVDTKAHILFVNAIPSPEVLQFMLGGSVVTGPVNFGSADTGYIAVEPGPFKVRLIEPGDTSFAYVESNINIAKGNYYTIIGTSDAGRNLSATILGDDVSAAPSGMVRIRLINQSPDSKPIKLSFAGSGMGALIQNVTYSTTSAFSTTAAGSYKVRLQENDATGGQGGIVPDIDYTFVSGHVYTVILSGEIGGETVKGLIIDNTP